MEKTSKIVVALENSLIECYAEVNESTEKKSVLLNRGKSTVKNDLIPIIISRYSTPLPTDSFINQQLDDSKFLIKGKFVFKSLQNAGNIAYSSTKAAFDYSFQFTNCIVYFKCSNVILPNYQYSFQIITTLQCE